MGGTRQALGQAVVLPLGKVKGITRNVLYKASICISAKVKVGWVGETSLITGPLYQVKSTMATMLCQVWSSGQNPEKSRLHADKDRYIEADK